MLHSAVLTLLKLLKILEPATIGKIVRHSLVTILYLAQALKIAQYLTNPVSIMNLI